MMRNANGLLYRLANNKYRADISAGIIFGFAAILKLYYGAMAVARLIVKKSEVKSVRKQYSAHSDWTSVCLSVAS